VEGILQVDLLFLECQDFDTTRAVMGVLLWRSNGLCSCVRKS
jgi:hypothetical protein